MDDEEYMTYEDYKELKDDRNTACELHAPEMRCEMCITQME